MPTIIPDFITLALDRLQISAAEIPGIKRVFRLAPQTSIADGDLPAIIIRI
jgi:hypothetical protein